MLGAIFGAVLTGLIGRLVDVRRRHDRQTELVIALHAEMVASLTKVREQNRSEEIDYARRDSNPFAVADDTDYVFGAVRNDPAILPKDIIYPVIRYYKLAGQSNAMTRGLSEPAFREDQPVKAKKKYVNQLIDLMAEQEKAGHVALEAVERFAASRGETDLAGHRTAAGIKFRSDTTGASEMLSRRSKPAA
jgi:hypothetical protein